MIYLFVLLLAEEIDTFVIISLYMAASLFTKAIYSSALLTAP